MARLITADNLSSRDLKGFRKETQELIKIALAAGWTGHEATRGNLTLRGAKQGGSPIHLSRSSRNASGPLNQLKEKIWKFGDPVMVAALQGAMTSSVSIPDPELVPEGKWKLDTVGMHVREIIENLPPHLVIPLRRLSTEEVNEAIDHITEIGFKGSAEEVAGELIKYHKEKQEAAQVAKKAVTEERHIVSSHPYLSHKNKGSDTRPGKSYESQTIIERKWSDGVVDYVCKFGDYSGDNPNSITSHWRKHTRAGEVDVVGNWADAGIPLVDDPTYTKSAYSKAPFTREEPAVIEEKDYNPREDRVESLAEELLVAIKDGDMSDLQGLAIELARRSLTWVHDQQGTGEPREPETPEEILNKIRSLVDRGEYARMRQAALEAEEMADEAQARAERAEKRNEKLKSDLGTLRDLLSSVSGDEEEE
jgi:hypothetical protein